MDGAILVWLLCLQGCLLVNSLNCVDKGTTSPQTEEYRRECLGGDATKVLYKKGRRSTDTKGKRKALGPGAFSVISFMDSELTKKPAITMEPTKHPPPISIELSRQKRELGSEKDGPRKPYYPGGTSVTGQPMRLMLAERSRRQLPNTRTRPRRKPRVGSFSLLTHRQPKSLQVTRVRRHLHNDKKKKKKKMKPQPTSWPGQYSIWGDPLIQVGRVKRQLQNDKKPRPWPGIFSPIGRIPRVDEGAPVDKVALVDGVAPVDKVAPVEVARVKRQLLKDKKKRRKKKPQPPPGPGNFSPIGALIPGEGIDLVETARVKRNLPPKKKNKIVCS